MGCQNPNSEKANFSKDEKILGKWAYKSHRIDEKNLEAVNFQKEKGRGIKSLSYTFYDDKTYFTRAEIFKDVYSHSGTYHFENDMLVLHSNSEDIDRSSRIVMLQKDLLILQDEIGFEVTFSRGSN